MRIGTCAVLMGVLAGCASLETTTPTEASLLRDPSAQIASQVDVAAGDLSGLWQVRQAAGDRWPALEDAAVFEARGTTLVIPPSAATCDARGPCMVAAGSIEYLPLAAGRWRAASPEAAMASSYPVEIWVYWMDFDNRTVALGDPTGNVVAILDRSATGGGDRITAAREILDWFGYDLSLLR